jgi:HEAT repeat protein
MGFFGKLFGGGDDAGEEGATKGDKQILKLQKKLMNKYVQTNDRKRVISILSEIGSDEALTALLGRFKYVTDGSIVDEDEKELVYEIIRSKGPAVIPVLRRFISSEVNIYWPLRALTEIGGDEAAVETLLEALNGINDRFDRSMERMTNLVSCFRDYDQPAVLDKLIELVSDDSEEVRFLSVDGLTTFAEHSKAVDAIMDRLVDDEETGRVKTYIMDTLIENRWNVKKYKKQLADKLPESYFVDDTGVIQRRY